ncbi:ATP-dependent helicase [Butyrivibrio sp. AC2005]|uniref:ATP-dependent helicase n=1 Tax=Butyrivibrio sp. AC2005 TaxID=1280672 RepID=UPI0003FDEAF2|nr:ATP-dependent helicase [Butyrivibrio sp. AC2005]
MTENEFLQKYAKSLSNQQLDAVTTIDGPVLLLAVPGSGKTTVLVNRLGYMLYCKAVAPENILTLTYTVAATRDMAQRFEGIFGEGISSRLEFRTINGICAKIIAHYGRLIGKSAFELITDEKVVGRILTENYVRIYKEYPTESDIKNVRTLITYCKNMMLTKDEILALEKETDSDIYAIYEAYNRELKNRGLMDYDDQMIYAYRMLKGSPELLSFYKEKYRYICVDEAQDTSKIQHMIIGLLSGAAGNLFMVGDEDQSIYGFRAAYPEALLNFEKDHPGAKVLVMDKNYRSNANIVEAADRFIGHNTMRHDKHMQATKDRSADINYIQLGGRRNQYNYLFKVASDISKQTAVLYRDNESVLPLVDILERQGVNYRIKSADMAFFTHRVVMDVISIMRFSIDPYDSGLFMKIYFKFQNYLNKKQAEMLCRIAASEDIPILDAIEETEMINGRVKGKCRSLRTHLSNMRYETPHKALLRIDKYMGYGEYLEDNHLDYNKIFILRELSKNEETIDGFLRRLDELQEILRGKEQDYRTKFILSTIHSSKGLEYDEVYLMDVCDGVFPDAVVKNPMRATPQELRDFEEERRIFYVGMTRARNKLNIFTYSDEEATFVKEISELPARDRADTRGESDVRERVKKAKASIRRSAGIGAQTKGKSVSGTWGKGTTKGQIDEQEYPTDLIIGQRILQPKYGNGVITDVTYDEDAIPSKFSVMFDDGKERLFAYPFAFVTGMKLMD